MRPRVTALSCGLAVAAVLLPCAVSRAQIDRHPELKSRAVAWTEFDGSYLVDTNSRAEMLDFFWTVFNRPYPPTGWTGSLNPVVAGTTSELWRIREYAQLNAYRALNGSPPMAEDPSKLDYVQAGALLLALNPDKPFGHITDPSWIGYNEVAADALRRSQLTGVSVMELSGAADHLVCDNEVVNALSVGHRSYLLHDDSVVGALGGAYDSRENLVCAWNAPFSYENSPSNNFIAFPAPGESPIGLLRYRQQFRWSFVPLNDSTQFRIATDAEFYELAPGLDRRDATVTATVNGTSVPVHNLFRNNPPWPLTWDFDPTYLDFEKNDVADGTTVSITVHDVAELAPERTYVLGYRDYSYTVRFFDEKKIVPMPPSPRTPLINLSTRTLIGRGDQQLIAGFSVDGTAPIHVAVRAQGPSLTNFNIKNPAQSTRVRVYDSAGNLLGENAAWQHHPNWRLLNGTNTAPLDSREGAMLLTLWPGTYTAVVSDDIGASGVGIVEAFNIDNSSQTRLVNLSSRGFVGANDAQMIAGFSLSQPRTIVIRTQGSALAKYGISNPVTDTVLTVVAQADGRIIATNDDWNDGYANQRLTTDLAGFAPPDRRDSALVLSLPAGAYTAVVSSKVAPGVGIVELFEIGD